MSCGDRESPVLIRRKEITLPVAGSLFSFKKERGKTGITKSTI
jgi:hypothetical protein